MLPRIWRSRMPRLALFSDPPLTASEKRFRFFVFQLLHFGAVRDADLVVTIKFLLPLLSGGCRNSFCGLVDNLLLTRRLSGLDADIRDRAGELDAIGFFHILKQAETLFFVLDEWITLTIGAQIDARAEV